MCLNCEDEESADAAERVVLGVVDATLLAELQTFIMRHAIKIMTLD